MLQLYGLSILDGWIRRAVVMLFLLISSPLVLAQEAVIDNQKDDSLIIMQAFNEQAIADAKSNEISEEDRHQILFVMGVVLLVLLIATAYFGISMGVGGKDVFVQHMVCAALSLTLAGVHAVTAIVWFFPF